MEAQYWHQKWDEEKIGFHQSEVNKRLVRFWPQLSLIADDSTDSPARCVFVPLCGKSLDMLWLHQQGHHVLGSELSDKAAQAFFNDNQLSFESRRDSPFTVYTGTDKAAGMTILAGDYFALTAEHCNGCAAFYDRASMIAMNPDMRRRYARHLAMLMPTGSQGLLLTISYDQSRMQGPPFSVTDENARQLLSDGFNINKLAHYSGPERLGNLSERGLETLDEWVYLLHRK